MGVPNRLNSVPRRMLPIYKKVVDAIDEVCGRYLNQEYHDLARNSPPPAHSLPSTAPCHKGGRPCVYFEHRGVPTRAHAPHEPFLRRA
jgi:hypothetical protein